MSVFAVSASGNFNIQMSGEFIQGISHRYCELIQRNDGNGCSLTNGATTRNSRDQAGFKAKIAKQSALTSPPLMAVYHAQI